MGFQVLAKIDENDLSVMRAAHETGDVEAYIEDQAAGCNVSASFYC